MVGDKLGKHGNPLTFRLYSVRKYAITIRLKIQYKAVHATNWIKNLKDFSDTTPPTLKIVSTIYWEAKLKTPMNTTP